MTKYALIVALVMGITTAGMAQSKSELKGPQAKNFKVWKQDPADYTQVYNQNIKANLKGPAAKNYSPAKAQEAAKVTPVEDVTFGRKPLKGPKAKNRKIWRE